MPLHKVMINLKYFYFENFNLSKINEFYYADPVRLQTNIFTIIKQFSDDFAYHAYDVYKIDEKSDVVEVRKYFQWNNSIGLYTAEENIWKRRSDLKGFHIRYIDLKLKYFQTLV